MAGPIQVQCSECQAVLQLKSDDAVGKKAKCPKCGQTFVVRPVSKSSTPVKPAARTADGASSGDDDFLGSLNELALSGKPIARPRAQAQNFEDDDDEPSAAPARPRRRQQTTHQKAAKPESPAASPSVVFLMWLLFGGLGAILGGALWVGLLVATGSASPHGIVVESVEEADPDFRMSRRTRRSGTRVVGYLIGCVAAVVGAATGLGVRWTPGTAKGWAPGATAAVLAVVSVLAAKYVASAASRPSESPRAPIQSPVIPESDMIALLTHEVIADFDARGQEYEWPSGMDIRHAFSERDFPPEVWAEAKRRWESKSPSQREQALDDFAKTLEETDAAMAAEDSGAADLSHATLTPLEKKPTFALIDAVWITIAGYVAYFFAARLDEREKKKRVHSASGP